MFGSLKKLFDNGSAPAAPPRASAPPPPKDAFLQREAIFDRRRQLAGHLFQLQTPASAHLAPGERDAILLDTLAAQPAAWASAPAFVPLASSSLDLAAVDRLPAGNLTLLLRLEPESTPDRLAPRLEALHGRGLRIGVFREPRHPAFAPVLAHADVAAIDIGHCEAATVRDFSAAIRSGETRRPVQLLGCAIDTLDDHRLCHQWHYELFHGPFAETAPPRAGTPGSDPHKVQLLHLMRLMQGEAENAEIVDALKQDPLLTFRVLRYLNSPALGLNHSIDSLDQALMLLGRQRLGRWLSVLLFSVREPDFSDWLLVESALTRGRLMEELAARLHPGQAVDPFFLTGIFSCLDRLLRCPLAEALSAVPLSAEVRAALLQRQGPYAPLLTVAEAGDHFDLTAMAAAAQAAGVSPDAVNRALLAATAWASEVTEHWA